jgi:hypothetical protein
MLISEFIAQLERVKEQHGDREVGIYDSTGEDTAKIRAPELCEHHFSDEVNDYGVTIW